MRGRGGIVMGSSELCVKEVKELVSTFELKIELLWKILEGDLCF